ncbi:hypothetical protein CLOACE_15990 [Clostridium acetireducens DSM 10703]|uniref:Glucose / sorbosone dehydrogenase n=1 Tax=Clostridium acetireducens DSM 10703 TaxID=1121290 RepID=A0A1E8EXQ3_9CLOT|nr:hypothetical protein [Clostridium acetireducens]OFI05593.1 hypothetical protein CLOACE_15990 [Clostridium acetireducens DSM 10703]
MKKITKIIKIILTVFFIVICSVFLKKQYYNNYNINIKDNHIKWNIVYKGLKYATDFCTDSYGNYYISYPNRIQYIDKNGKSYDVIKDNNLNIMSIDYYKNYVFYSSKNSIYRYNINSKESKEIISNIPNFGDYKNVIVKVNDNNLFISIGSVTNSGVVGKDNTWLEEYAYGHDIPPKDVVLNGINYDKGKTGGFSTYKTKSIKGQVIPGHFLGNSSVICYSLQQNTFNTFAWGIRNVTDFDFNSKKQLIASIGGMEDRGARPVKGDSDYIYFIEKGVWYGWPDFSGGDPVNSPRFKGKNDTVISFMLKSHPNNNPPAPLYRHSRCSSINKLAIDKSGKIGKKDSIYFYDVYENSIYEFNECGIIKKILSFDNKSKIESMMFVDGKLIALDSNTGYLIAMSNNILKNTKNIRFSLRYIVLVILLIFIVVILMLRFITKSKQ